MSLNSNVAVKAATHNESPYSGRSKSAGCSFSFHHVITSSFNRFCYELDNDYNTHRAKRSCLFQAHYKNDDNLEGIRKRKREAIWQLTFSFLPLTDRTVAR